jgi:hypothetical protein
MALTMRKRLVIIGVVAGIAYIVVLLCVSLQENMAAVQARRIAIGMTKGEVTYILGPSRGGWSSYEDGGEVAYWEFDDSTAIVATDQYGRVRRVSNADGRLWARIRKTIWYFFER